MEHEMEKQKKVRKVFKICCKCYHLTKKCWCTICFQNILVMNQLFLFSNLRLHGMMNMFVSLWNSAFQHPLQYLYLSLFGCCPYHTLFDRIEYYLHWHIKVWYNSNFYSFSFRQKSCKNCWQEMFSALDSYWTLWGRGITWQSISIIGNGSLLNG